MLLYNTTKKYLFGLLVILYNMKELSKCEMLYKNLKEYQITAKESYAKGRWNASLVLYFKAIVTAIDIYIYSKEKIIPSNHEERFGILKGKYPFFYSILEKDFPLYRETYRLLISKEQVNIVRADLDEVLSEIKSIG